MKTTVTVLILAIAQFGQITGLTCWNAKCIWTASARTSCISESVAQCTGLHCVSYLLNSTIEAIQCLDYLPTLSGMTSCNSQDKCICSTTISAIACPNVTAPVISLASGGQANTIYVDENAAVDTQVAAFRAVDYYNSTLSMTVAIATSNPTTFSDYFYLSNTNLLVKKVPDYETLHASGANFTISISASNGAYSSTSTFSVTIVDVNEAPSSCTDALSNTVTNNTARILYANSNTLPITATVDVDTITCTDPDQYNQNYRIISATLMNFAPTFSTNCTSSSSATTSTNQCALRAGIGTEFYYNSRLSYQPIWVISQLGSSFTLTTTSSIVINFTNPALSFDSTMPTSITFTTYNWPIALPQEIFNFGIWTNRSPYQNSLNYTLCSSTCTTSTSCSASPYFAVNQYTGKLSLTSSSANSTDYSSCVWITDGTTTISKSVTIVLQLYQPPNITTTVTSDVSYVVPLVALSELKVATITPSLTSGTVTRYLFYVSNCYPEYDSQVFRLDTTDQTASLVMRSFVPLATSNPTIITIKVIGVGSVPSAEAIAYTNPITITRSTLNYAPYVDTNTAVFRQVTPGKFSDNQLIGEFYVYLYRSYAYSAPEAPTIAFDRKDMIYAVLSESEVPALVSKNWYKFQVRLYSLPATRFDFGPFSINMTITDSSISKSYQLNIYPVDTYMALDSAMFNFCFTCDSCDVAFVGVPQRCAINETYCCSRTEPGSRTSRYCSAIEDFTEIVSCCSGKLCNQSPSSVEIPTKLVLTVVLFMIFISNVFDLAISVK